MSAESDAIAALVMRLKRRLDTRFWRQGQDGVMYVISTEADFDEMRWLVTDLIEKRYGEAGVKVD